jgi:hypothetical protein
MELRSRWAGRWAQAGAAGARSAALYTAQATSSCPGMQEALVSALVDCTAGTAPSMVRLQLWRLCAVGATKGHRSQVDWHARTGADEQPFRLTFSFGSNETHWYLYNVQLRTLDTVASALATSLVSGAAEVLHNGHAIAAVRGEPFECHYLELPFILTNAGTGGSAAAARCDAGHVAVAQTRLDHRHTMPVCCNAAQCTHHCTIIQAHHSITASAAYTHLVQRCWQACAGPSSS